MYALRSCAGSGKERGGGRVSSCLGLRLLWSGPKRLCVSNERSGAGNDACRPLSTRGSVHVYMTRNDCANEEASSEDLDRYLSHVSIEDFHSVERNLSRDRDTNHVSLTSIPIHNPQGHVVSVEVKYSWQADLRPLLGIVDSPRSSLLAIICAHVSLRQPGQHVGLSSDVLKSTFLARIQGKVCLLSDVEESESQFFESSDPEHATGPSSKMWSEVPAISSAHDDSIGAVRS